jgi:hypothetical protein
MFMEEDVLKKLEEQGVKIDKIWRSVEKTRKYFLWTLIITLVTFVLPLIVLLVFLPQIIKVYTGGLSF